MNFDFNNELVAQSNIDIESFGNIAIEGSDANGFFYYFVTKTIMGETQLVTFGPVVQDIETILDGFSFISTVMDYNEKKLQKNIFVWLNDKKHLVDAKIIEQKAAFAMIPDLKTTLSDFE